MAIPVFHIKYRDRAVRVVRSLMQDASKVCAVSDAIDVLAWWSDDGVKEQLD